MQPDMLRVWNGAMVKLLQRMLRAHALSNRLVGPAWRRLRGSMRLIVTRRALGAVVLRFLPRMAERRGAKRTLTVLTRWRAPSSRETVEL
ncbi:hypothetical protein DK412_15925 [Methylobacterium sp. 17Sr1-1]|nr:hypothetical protein DK412_15925 [Methylobacterium sp. 17Sr1-1]